MGLQIKSGEVERLARELAAMTGEPLEASVERALRGQIEREREIERVRAAVKRISERYARLPVLDDRTPDEIIGYDENGLPT